MEQIISVEQAQSIYKNTNVTIIDATWYLPNDNKNAAKEYINNHIPNAHFFNINTCVDNTSALPHSLPPPEVFQKTMRSLGIHNNTHVIVYDQVGYFSAPRVYFYLKYFGHSKISILNGGLKAWKQNNLPVEQGEPQSPVKSNWSGKPNPSLLINSTEILDSLGSKLIIDARSELRFLGKAPEPREGLRSGHIPYSKNIPYDTIFNKENGKLKTITELQTIMHDVLPKDKTQPIVCSCGSGITACTIMLALEILGYNNTRLYDGSWAEWGANKNLPIT